VPATDPGQGQLAYSHRRQVRRNLTSEKAVIVLDRLGTQARTLLDPGRGIVRDQDFARIGVDPVSLQNFGLFEREPPLSLTLSGEGVRCGSPREGGDKIGHQGDERRPWLDRGSSASAMLAMM
jgi:hypothetical protein